jgi:cellulose synthase/poly-beta-1,6-N-acetylglucosamine synthase-like glycosyltransferase
MTVTEVFFWLLLVVGMINFVHLGLYTIGANIYDMKQFRRATKAKKANLPAYTPHVTVLIPAHNEEMGVIRTIETVSANNYPNLSIVVVDDASTDHTPQLVREYIAKNRLRTLPSTVVKDGKTVHTYERVGNLPPICLLELEKNVGKGAALNYALTHAVTGGLTMTLDADSSLHPNAIANAVEYFRDEHVVGVAANVKIMEQHTILGMLQKFEHMIGYRSKKFYTITNSEFILGGVASTYRYETLKSVGFYDTDTSTEDIGLSLKVVSQGNKHQRIVYAANVVATTEGVQSYKALFRQRYRWKQGSMQNLIKYRALFGNLDNAKYSRMLTWYRIPFAVLSEIILLIQPILLSFIVVQAITHRMPGLLVGGYLTVTVYVLWNLLPDEHHTFAQKMLLSLYVPIMYFCFFIMDTVQIVAIIRCLINARQLGSNRDEQGTWTSPKRAGIIQPAL